MVGVVGAGDVKYRSARKLCLDAVQTAIHAAGRYALIQELWVHPSWRSHEIGSDLLIALFALARERQITRVEVGLPRESFAGIVATEVFYRRNGFTPLGPRMRWERT